MDGGPCVVVVRQDVGVDGPRLGLFACHRELLHQAGACDGLLTNLLVELVRSTSGWIWAACGEADAEHTEVVVPGAVGPSVDAGHPRCPLDGQASGVAAIVSDQVHCIPAVHAVVEVQAVLWHLARVPRSGERELQAAEHGDRSRCGSRRGSRRGVRGGRVAGGRGDGGGGGACCCSMGAGCGRRLRG